MTEFRKRRGKLLPDFTARFEIVIKRNLAQDDDHLHLLQKAQFA